MTPFYDCTDQGGRVCLNRDGSIRVWRVEHKPGTIVISHDVTYPPERLQFVLDRYCRYSLELPHTRMLDLIEQGLPDLPVGCTRFRLHGQHWSGISIRNPKFDRGCLIVVKASLDGISVNGEEFTLDDQEGVNAAILQAVCQQR